MALISTLVVTQDHWKWYHPIDRIEFLLAFHTIYGTTCIVCEMLVENREIFIHLLYLVPRSG